MAVGAGQAAEKGGRTISTPMKATFTMSDAIEEPSCAFRMMGQIDAKGKQLLPAPDGDATEDTDKDKAKDKGNEDEPETENVVHDHVAFYELFEAVLTLKVLNKEQESKPSVQVTAMRRTSSSPPQTAG